MTDPTLPGLITFSDACLDPQLFGPWFEGDSWANWRVVDKAIFGEPLTEDELAIFTELTGRSEAPTAPAKELWLAFGRRSAKDLKAGAICTYLATIGAERYGTRARLTRGERGVVQLLAVDRDQAEVCMGYVRSYFEQPMFEAMLSKPPTATQIELNNNITIEITTNDRRRVRGRTVIACVLSEVAHWKGEATVNPDEDVYQSIKPAMATIPNAMVIGISSPYSRRGLFWNKFKENWGIPSRTIFMRAPTWVMNPTLPRDGETIEEAFASDPAWASGEYGAEWRTDIESFVSREAVDACVDWGVFERPYQAGQSYFGFVDPSGGSNDSMTLAISHKQDDIAVHDLIREVRPPFSPEAVVNDFVDLLKRYRISKVTGDRYAVDWVQEPFRKHGIAYDPAKPKSDIYRDFLPLINSGKVRLLGNKRMIGQLLNLERRTSRAGKDSIDHPPAGHDDLVNAAAGALLLASARKQSIRMGYYWPYARPGDPPGNVWNEPREETRIKYQQVDEYGRQLSAEEAWAIRRR
jgi:hypothetical protein